MCFRREPANIDSRIQQPGSPLVKIRTFEPDDEIPQAELFNAVASAFPGFKPATPDEVRRRTRNPTFDPTTRFYAQVNGRVVGYCVLEPEQGRISFPWCAPGFADAAPQLLEAATRSARERGVVTLFAAYRRDWLPVQRFFADHGFSHARDIVNYWGDTLDSPTAVNRSKYPITRLQREDVPAVAAMGRGLLRLPVEKLEPYFFANPHLPAEAFQVVRDRATGSPLAVGVGVRDDRFADVRKIDPQAPCFRLGAFGTEGLNAKRVNGLFSFLVADPDQAMRFGTALLSETSTSMTGAGVTAVAAQCPSDAPHLVALYERYFKEQGRFPVLEKRLA